MDNTNNTGASELTRAQRVRCKLKAAAAATAMLPVGWLLLPTPVGFTAVILLTLFVVEPLDSLGLVDLGKPGRAMFEPNYAGWTLLAAPFWLFFFWLFFVLFRARTETAAGIVRTRTPTSSGVAIGDRVVILTVESCLTERTNDERERLLALVGTERSVVDLDRFGCVWLSFSASDDNADFCLSSKEVARVE